MTEATINFIDHLVASVPDLEDLLREHLSDNFGEVLPHVFFGEIARFAVSEASQFDDGLAGEHRISSSLEALLRELDDGVATGGDITELICVSFLENLPRQGQPGDHIRDVLGPNLRAELDEVT
jgi:hypothetical protein